MKTTSCRHHQGREGGGGGGGKGKGGKGGKEEEKAEADKDDKDVKSLSRRCRGRMPWKGKATNLGLGQHTGNNHLLFFYFVSLHISKPHKKRDAGEVVLVERAVQRGVFGEQSCLIYFYFRAPNTACGEEGVEVEHSTLVLLLFLPQSPQSLESREREIRGHKELECGGSRGKCL